MVSKMNGESLDLTKQNIQRLKELFPEVLTDEEKVDFDMLKTLLGEIVEDNNERYQFMWHSKKQTILGAQRPSKGTLRPVPEKSKNFDKTENLYIEGDNLEVLKLLQKSYNGKVKMIYIDPPYNTGQDFIYKDDYNDSIGNYLSLTNQIDDNGNVLFTNNETNGRFHTDWLNMIYSRIKLAKNLLTDDGVIFISIDDNEIENLIKVCDEIFSPKNHINTITVKMKNVAGASGGGQDKRLKKNKEYIVCYTKNIGEFESFKNVYDYTPLNQLIQQYQDEGVSWKYTSVLIEEGEKVYVGSTVDGDGNEIKIFARHNYTIQSVNQTSKNEGITEEEVYKKYARKIFQTQMPQSSIRPRVMERVNELGRESELYSIEYIPKTGRNRGVIYEQFYKGENFRLFAWLKDVSEEIDGNLYKKDLQGDLWDFVAGTKNLTKEGDVPFPNGKKPVALLQRLIEMQSDKESIILDFFSGSATTAHAVMKQNMEDGGNRKFILVQLPENLDDSLKLAKDENRKQILTAIEFLDSIGKPHILSEIGLERIRRSGEKIKQELIEKQQISGMLDEKVVDPESVEIGFKVLKLDTSNIREWNVDFEDLEDSLDLYETPFVEGRSEMDIVYEIMLKQGLELTYPIHKFEVDGKTIYDIAFGNLFICLSNKIDVAIAQAIIARRDEYGIETSSVIFSDAGFSHNDSEKLNCIELLKDAGYPEDNLLTI
ncbi:site-specific DNA-methyltransferase [Lysinibacillus sp. BW-2-10]|uniref:site-specific DNA-methyltransferase n=1 Tax=Lysinibacillus sp. BW-2-10 TaxID=2590030 RepID=UPI00117CE52D|nr:site-specific DNA-methyltransferase [Lysinibacillus sp. BW-2-10]TSI07649.1 site-specific DNA-methyltransferase [Lysinibacillus sp. BW-2-10]